jgi:hypothetical protein
MDVFFPAQLIPARDENLISSSIVIFCCSLSMFVENSSRISARNFSSEQFLAIRQERRLMSGDECHEFTYFVRVVE